MDLRFDSGVKDPVNVVERHLDVRPNRVVYARELSRLLDLAVEDGCVPLEFLTNDCGFLGGFSKEW